ncbi:MAG: hypothetical protein JKY93_08450 [Gammaproteobacteria bacterium]|nr:hypothetical protein [Gammaproteobacteria bacterium]
MTAATKSMLTVTGWLKSFTELGLTLILALVVLDILFPGTTGIIGNLGVIVAQFSREGLSGLIALLLFLIMFKNK